MRIKILFMIFLLSFLFSNITDGQEVKKCWKTSYVLSKSDFSSEEEVKAILDINAELDNYRLMSIQLLDSLGNVKKETKPIFKDFRVNEDTTHIIATIGPDLGINGYFGLFVCLDMELNLIFVFPPQVRGTGNFYDGVAEVTADPFRQRAWGYLDISKGYVFEPRYEHVYRENGKFYAIKYNKTCDTCGEYMWKSKCSAYSEEVIRYVYIPDIITWSINVSVHRSCEQFMSKYIPEVQEAFKDDKPKCNLHNGISYMLSENWKAASKCFIEVLESDDAELKESAEKNLEVVKAAMESSMAE